MRELLVEVLTSLVHSNPYLLGAAVLIAAFWLFRSVIHKARIFTEQLTGQIRDSKRELREWGTTLRKLKREVTNWRSD